MLEIQEPDYFADVQKFAKKVNKYEQLWEKLNYLDGYACQISDKIKDNRLTRCRLFRDFAPYSFYFVMERLDVKTGEYKTWFNGGLIFHGTHDGGGDGSAPTFSVCLTPTDGWSIHT